MVASIALKFFGICKALEEGPIRPAGPVLQHCSFLSGEEGQPSYLVSSKEEKQKPRGKESYENVFLPGLHMFIWNPDSSFEPGGGDLSQQVDSERKIIPVGSEWRIAIQSPLANASF